MTPLRAWALILPLAAFALLVLLPPGAHAATTTVHATCTMDNGAPSVTLALSENPNDGGLSPTSLPCDGADHDITVDQSVTLTANEPSPGANEEWTFSGGFPYQKLQVGTLSSYSWSLTNYNQLQNTYAVTTNGQGPPTWDSGLSCQVTGQVDGAPGVAVATLFPTAGSTVSVSAPGWADYNRAVTFCASMLGAGQGTQWAASGQASFSDTTGGNTHTVAFYKQFQDTYEAIPNAAPTFDSGMTWTITGTYLGVADSPICTIPSAASPATCIGFSDYDTKVSFPSQAQSSPGFTRWSAGVVVSYTPTTPLNTYKVNYYKQVSETFSYSISDGSSGFTAPILLCTQYGSVVNCVSLATSPTQCWLDFGSRWTTTSPLLGSASDQRWSSRNATGNAAAAAATVVPYYHQFLVTLSYRLIGGGVPSSPPSVSYNAYGRPVRATLNQTASGAWMDSGQSFSLKVPSGSATERWRSPKSTFPVSDGVSYPIFLYNQFSLILSYEVNGGGSGYVPPTLTFSNFSQIVMVSLTRNALTYWADAGENWTVTTRLLGSSASERWQTNQVGTSKAAGSTTLQLLYYHQFYDGFAYSVVGGGSGYSAPTITFMQFGTAIVGNQGWVDADSNYSFTEPLPGSTASVRWDSGNGTGIATSSETVNATYYHQYAYLLSFSAVSPTVVVGSPLLNYIALGSPASEPIASSPAVIWLDSGTGWSVIPAFAGSSVDERWATQQATSGSANSSQTDAFTFYSQFYVTIGYAVIGGGSPGVPSVSYAAFANRASTQLSNGSQSIWVNAGSRWTLPALLPGSNELERWIVKGPNTATVLAASSDQATYLHQFFLETTSNSAMGGTFRNETQWADGGTSFNLNASALPGWEFIYWKGSGAGAYNGTSATLNFSLSGPANEVAVFYPGLTIIVSGGGHVLYSAPGVNGSASGGDNVVYVPLGSNVTLKAVPTIFDIVFQGWSQAAKGKAPQISLKVDAPKSVSASFGLDYSDIEIIGATIPIVTVLAIYVFVVRRLRSKKHT